MFCSLEKNSEGIACWYKSRNKMIKKKYVYYLIVKRAHNEILKNTGILSKQSNIFTVFA